MKIDTHRVLQEVRGTIADLQARGQLEPGVEAEDAQTASGVVEVRLSWDDELFTLSMLKRYASDYLATLDHSNGLTQSLIVDARNSWVNIIRDCCLAEKGRREKDTRG